MFLVWHVNLYLSLKFSNNRHYKQQENKQLRERTKKNARVKTATKNQQALTNTNQQRLQKRGTIQAYDTFGYHA